MMWPWISRRKMEQIRKWDYLQMRSRSTYAERCAAREGYDKGLADAIEAVAEMPYWWSRDSALRVIRNLERKQG